jgi:hypothetical protein
MISVLLSTTITTTTTTTTSSTSDADTTSNTCTSTAHQVGNCNKQSHDHRPAVEFLGFPPFEAMDPDRT